MAAEPGSVQFSIGRVIGSSFGVYARNFIGFTVLAAVISLINVATGFVIGTDPNAIAAGQFDVVPIVIGVIVGIIVSALTQAAIIYGTFQDLRGQKAGMAACISRGIATMIPVIVGSILFSLAVVVGLTLLIIPGIILLLMWWVYIPVVVVENEGIMGSFGRSSALTRGRRWHLLGLLLVIVLISIVISSVLVGSVAAIIMTAQSESAFFAVQVIQYVISAMITAFSAVMIAVTYYYLRAEKEGIDVNAIAQVFD